MMTKIKLFCFPYAGASSFIFHPWKAYLKGLPIELRPVELAGRGKRVSEPLYSSRDEMIEDLFERLKDELVLGRYVLFGHSMGAIIAFELALHIRKMGFPEPTHVFFSGRQAPHTGSNRKVYHTLPKFELMSEILKLGGSPKELFEDSGVANFFLPLIRNDFKLCETYSFTAEIDPFEFGISVFVGMDEKFSDDEILDWRYYTHSICSIYYYPGSHFFINNHGKQIINNIAFHIGMKV